MSKGLPLGDRILQEKLAAIELPCPESGESPTWHKNVLDERRHHVAEGKVQFTDWEAAKVQIRNKVQ